MSLDSPSSILYDNSGVALAVQDNVALVASQPALMVAGFDGTNTQFISVNAAGQQVIVGAGVAGTPSGGVVSVQGVVGGTAIPVTPGTSGTGTQSSVARSATDVTILASNANRKGASVYNENGRLLLLVGSGTSSATVYTVEVGPSSYYEVPAAYTGILKGLWTSAGGGSARVTEWT